MSAGVTYPHIEKRDAEPARLQRVPRVRVAQIIMDHLAYGWSAEEICRQHPYLRPAEIYAAMGYYYDHPDEIEAEIRAEAEQAENARSSPTRSPFYLRMHAKGIF